MCIESCICQSNSREVANTRLILSYLINNSFHARMSISARESLIVVPGTTCRHRPRPSIDTHGWSSVSCRMVNNTRFCTASIDFCEITSDSEGVYHGEPHTCDHRNQSRSASTRSRSVNTVNWSVVTAVSDAVLSITEAAVCSRGREQKDFMYS